MNFCYLHPQIESEGQCSNCGNWICSKDYNLIKKDIGVRKEWVKGRNAGLSPFRNRNRPYQVTRIETAPVIYCPICYEKELGLVSEPNSIPSEKVYTQPKRVLMCTQCGEKLLEEDKFCPNCGDSTEDEFFDASHQTKGIQASKRLK